MNFNKILQSLFGNKSTRDMKLIQPIVEKIKAEYPKMQALSNDELRAKTKEQGWSGAKSGAPRADAAAFTTISISFWSPESC